MAAPVWHKAFARWMFDGDLPSVAPVVKGTNNMQTFSRLCELVAAGAVEVREKWRDERLLFMLFERRDDDRRSPVYCPAQLCAAALLWLHGPQDLAERARRWLGEWLWLMAHAESCGWKQPQCRCDVRPDKPAGKIGLAAAALRTGAAPKNPSDADVAAVLLARAYGRGLRVEATAPGPRPLVRLKETLVYLEGSRRSVLVVPHVNCIDTPIAGSMVAGEGAGTVLRHPNRAEGWIPRNNSHAHSSGQVGCDLEGSTVKVWSYCAYVKGKLGLGDAAPTLRRWDLDLGTIHGGWVWTDKFRRFGAGGPGEVRWTPPPGPADDGSPPPPVVPADFLKRIRDAREKVLAADGDRRERQTVTEKKLVELVEEFPALAAAVASLREKLQAIERTTSAGEIDQAERRRRQVAVWDALERDLDRT